MDDDFLGRNLHHVTLSADGSVLVGEPLSLHGNFEALDAFVFDAFYRRWKRVGLKNYKAGGETDADMPADCTLVSNTGNHYLLSNDGSAIARWYHMNFENIVLNEPCTTKTLGRVFKFNYAEQQFKQMGQDLKYKVQALSSDGKIIAYADDTNQIMLAQYSKISMLWKAIPVDGLTGDGFTMAFLQDSTIQVHFYDAATSMWLQRCNGIAKTGSGGEVHISSDGRSLYGSSLMNVHRYNPDTMLWEPVGPKVDSLSNLQYTPILSRVGKHLAIRDPDCQIIDFCGEGERDACFGGVRMLCSSADKEGCAGTPPLPSGPFEINITVAHDSNPAETAWRLLFNERPLLFQNFCKICQDGFVVEKSIRVPAGLYIFIIEDSWEDGLGPNGYFQVTVNGLDIYEGSNFQDSSGRLIFVIRDNGYVSYDDCSPYG